MNDASPQTIACRKIIAAIETALIGAHSPKIMIDNILTVAQSFVNEDGYTWDTALTMACRIYPRTAHCGRYAYAK